MPFPSPRAEDPSSRFEEAKAAARTALEDLVANANEAGWGSDEITVAICQAAELLKNANKRDPDPADDPPISDAASEQIGRGELYD